MQAQHLQPFGCEVTNIDVSKPTAEVAEFVRAKAAQHGVVVIRDQEIDDASFIAFLKSLGPLTFTKGERHAPGAPELNVVSNVGRTKPPRSVFHSDTSYVAKPPALTALRPVQLPQSGGATVFTDQYRAYDTLPERLRDKLHGAKIKHAVTGVTLEETDQAATFHPAFRTHPISGRTALYLSTPERCTAVSACSDDESAEIIAALFAHSTEPTHHYRHAWRAGDILLWDNRCTMHKADHRDVVGDRIFHRAMTAGETPIPAG